MRTRVRGQATAAPCRGRGCAVHGHDVRSRAGGQPMIKNPIPWPGGARCAVAFTFDMDAESLLHLYFPDTAPNRVAMAAMLRYDAEVAVPRLLELLRRFGLRQTFFVPGWCIEHYP